MLAFITPSITGAARSRRVRLAQLLRLRADQGGMGVKNEQAHAAGGHTVFILLSPEFH